MPEIVEDKEKTTSAVVTLLMAARGFQPNDLANYALRDLAALLLGSCPE